LLSAFIDLCSLSDPVSRAARATRATRATSFILEKLLVWGILRKQEHQQFAQHGFKSHVGGRPRDPFQGMLLQLRRKGQRPSYRTDLPACRPARLYLLLRGWFADVALFNSSSPSKKSPETPCAATAMRPLLNGRHQSSASSYACRARASTADWVYTSASSDPSQWTHSSRPRSNG